MSRAIVQSIVGNVKDTSQAGASSPRSSLPSLRLFAAPHVLEGFSDHLFQGHGVERGFRQLLQIVRDFHPAILRAPLVKRRIADPLLVNSYADRPAWRSFNIPMICSLNRLRFIVRCLAERTLASKLGIPGG